jgi:diguanylate cyclase (GGDEF)-like protein
MTIRPKTGYKIAVVDDDPIVVLAEQELLEAEGHEVRCAENVADAIDLVRSFDPDCLLLDYRMPGGTGADVVRAIRRFNQTTQVILVSSLTGKNPARQLLAELEIQGFHRKTDGNFRLLMSVDAALKHSRVLRGLTKQQHYLRHILDAFPEITRLQPVHELFGSALRHISELLDGADSLLGSGNGLVLIEGPDSGILVRAATGRFSQMAEYRDLPKVVANIAALAMEDSRPVARDGFVTIPLSTRGNDRGCILVEAKSLPNGAIDPCQLYANQVVQALENVILYERATVDPLTRVYNRGFGVQHLEKVLQAAAVSHEPAGVILLDVDHFKRLNDTHGHAAGDLALEQIANAMRRTCRGSDLVARYGGEEFVVILPRSPLSQSMVIAERMLATIRSLDVEYEGLKLKLAASAGVAVALEGETCTAEILRRADIALYRSKEEGRDRATGPDCALPEARAAV